MENQPVADGQETDFTNGADCLIDIISIKKRQDIRGQDDYLK